MFPGMTGPPWCHIWSENSPILRGRSQARPEGEGGSPQRGGRRFAHEVELKDCPPSSAMPLVHPAGSAAIHSRPGSPVAQARAYPGSRGGPTDPAGVGHRPPFQAGARFSKTGTRQHPSSGGGSTDTTRTHPGLAVKARTGRPEAGAGSHPRTGGRPPEPAWIGACLTSGDSQSNGHRRDHQNNDVLAEFLHRQWLRRTLS